VSNCYATGAVSGDIDYAGGLVGSSDGGTVSASFWNTETSGWATSAGGYAAIAATTAAMRKQDTYTIWGWDFANVWAMEAGGYPYLVSIGLPTDRGGNVGEGEGEAVTEGEAVAEGEAVTEGEAESEGEGEVDGRITIDSIAKLQKIGNDPAYPLSGDYVLSQDIDASATASWNSGEGFEPIGTQYDGFSGTFDGQGHVITGIVIAWPYGESVGLFGYSSGELKNLGIEGGAVSGGEPDITTTAVGGLVGANSGAVTACYTTCTVTVSAAYSFAGGLVGGNNDYGTVTNCFATGAVAAGSGYYTSVGGLAGVNSGTVTNCYAAGPVTGGEYGGGLAGAGMYASVVGTVTASFWDGQTSGQATSAGGGTKLSTAQMKTQSVFTEAGWDFVNVWAMKPGGYPYLIVLGPPANKPANEGEGEPRNSGSEGEGEPDTKPAKSLGCGASTDGSATSVGDGLVVLGALGLLGLSIARRKRMGGTVPGGWIE